MAAGPMAGPSPRIARIRLVGALALIALGVVIAWNPSWNWRLPAAGYDAHQILSPREVKTLPVMVVEVDEKSLAALGRWPWPRTLLAQLVDKINRHQPAVIGIDVFMPEPDPMDPGRLSKRGEAKAAGYGDNLAATPSHDAVLARSLAATRTVLPIAGTPASTGMSMRVPPFAVHQGDTSAESHSQAMGKLMRFGGATTSIDEINRAASGWGLISVDATGGTVRRVPLTATIGGTMVPAFAVEMLRVAMGAPSLRLVVAGTSVSGIAIGDRFIATEPDGGVRIHFSPRHAGRFVSAVDVMEDRVDPQSFRGQMVLVGVNGVGLGDYNNTPLGIAMPGSEIQAQLLENLLEGSALIRPSWAPALEAAVFVLLGGLLVWVTPTWRPRNAALAAALCLAVLVAIAHVAFRAQRLVLDAATPGLALLILFSALLMLTLAEATRQRKLLEREMQSQRERNARLAGELDAARQIQMAFLPDANQLRGDARVDIDAVMVPAREVGGDLYDFFRLDPRHLFLLVGDVAGKGLSASIFMAVSKALYKSTTLRRHHEDMGLLMSAANAEVSRDNPQMMFVTVFAGILDLDTGDLAYCNAGHENPYVVAPGDNSVGMIDEGGGPPLCAIDRFAYRGARYQLRPGELLCIVSDGVTEARNRAGELFGRNRVGEELFGLRDRPLNAREAVSTLRQQVDAFVDGAEPVDDLTILALRWFGRKPRET